MSALKDFVDRELGVFRRARALGRPEEAWTALERAHILSQPDAWLHTRVHLSMLGYGLECREWDEVAGQVVRTAVAGIGSLLGKAPVGNTGRSNVPIMRPMPIPPDLAELLERAGAVSTGRTPSAGQVRTE